MSSTRAARESDNIASRSGTDRSACSPWSPVCAVFTASEVKIVVEIRLLLMRFFDSQCRVTERGMLVSDAGASDSGQLDSLMSVETDYVV